MKEQDLPIKVEISYKTIIFAVCFLIGLWFLIQVRQIIFLIFLSIILLSALLKPVEWLNSKKIPRVLSVLMVYLLLIAAIAFTIGTIIPALVTETTDFINKLPFILSSVNDFLLFHQIPVENVSNIVEKQAQSFVGNVFSISTAIISSVVLIITVFVLTFYLLLEWKGFIKTLTTAFSPRLEKRILTIIEKVEGGLGGWVRGQMALSLAVGSLTFIGLTLLGVPYALPLSLIAGILEIIPIIGPIISAIPAILVGLTISPIIGLATLGIFLIVQQLENHLIVPMVMSRVVGLQPPVVIIALLIGTQLYGMGGAFLAIPVIIVIKILVKEFLSEDGVKEI